MDVVGGGDGPRAALWMAVGLFGIGALLLRPVDERRREDVVGGGVVPMGGPTPAG
jgi:hypothetical protein